MKIEHKKQINPQHIVSIEYIEDIQQTIVDTIDGRRHKFAGEEAKEAYDYYVEKTIPSQTTFVE